MYMSQLQPLQWNANLQGMVHDDSELRFKTSAEIEDYMHNLSLNNADYMDTGIGPYKVRMVHDRLDNSFLLQRAVTKT